MVFSSVALSEPQGASTMAKHLQSWGVVTWDKAILQTYQGTFRFCPGHPATLIPQFP